MALDKLVDSAVLDGYFEDIADAIRAKAVTEDQYSPEDMPQAILDIPSGGGGTAEKKQINFIDYDGTIVDSYTASEWQSVTALPSNPSHSGLTAQGWNWTKAQIDAQLTAMPDGDVWVGQMYITSSGDTEIDVAFEDSTRLSPTLTIAINGVVIIDWGDGTTPNRVPGSNISLRAAVPHTYSSTGNYTITIHVESGAFQFYGDTGYTLLRKNTNSNENRLYANCVTAVRFGSGVTSIANNAFINCASLKTVTIPSSITSFGASVFSNCRLLESLTIPSGVTTVMSSLVQYCYSLTSVALPSSITSIMVQAFYSCFSLTSITLSKYITSIDTYVFYNCYTLASITIPSGVTSIGNQAFYNCYALKKITIPSSVTSIGTQAFYNCTSLREIAIPSGVTSIAAGAFYSCGSLTSITIPSGVTSINNQTFFNCFALASITIPSGVTSIGMQAFMSCAGLAELHVKPTTPPTITASNVFNNISSDCVIYVPSDSLSDYQAATNWSAQSSKMQGE